MKISNFALKLSVVLSCCMTVTLFSFFAEPIAGFHIINVYTTKELHDFFRFTSDRIPFISSHRGGPREGLPENCIATFENTLRHTWSILEIDPRYTKDSAIVLMHDATLNRTSNGHGKVSDYTLEEVKKFKLKDTKGNITTESIPTLDEALKWAKGKTVLIIDMKDVPVDARVRKIREHQAQANAMVMVYSFADAKRCYELDNTIMMEVFIPDLAAAAEFDKTGVPWSNVVVFVTHVEPKDKGVFQYVHNKGAMCIRGSSRTIDKDFMDGKFSDSNALNEKYRQLITDGADIIEADLGVEAGKAIEKMQAVKSSKQKNFMVIK